jgi:hypothetical protein
MLAHRFRDSWASETARPISAVAGLAAPGAFMLCPCQLSAVQQNHAEYVYRVAFEQAQAEIARERRARWTAFSLN